MLDIKLNTTGDLDITPSGDIQLDNNPLQDARTAILWIEGEWRLGPDAGLPWFDELLVKNTNPDILSQQIRNALLAVEDIDDAEVELEEIDQRNRIIRFTFTISANGETYSEEVQIGG